VNLRGTIHEWIFKVCFWQKLSAGFEPAQSKRLWFSTWLRRVKISEDTIHEWILRWVFPIAIKTMLSADFGPVQFKRFRLCYGAHLTKTSWDEGPTKPSMSECQGVFRYIKNLGIGRFRTYGVQGKQILTLLWQPLNLDQLRSTSGLTIHEWILRCALREKKPCCRRVSNLSNPREPVFNSVAVSTWPRPVDIAGQRNHLWVNVNACSGIKKPCYGQVSNLWGIRETDGVSVVATSWLRRWLRSTSDETIH